MDIYEIVKKLVGNINPVGKSEVDADRLQNIIVICDLANKIIEDIGYVRNNNIDAYESSVVEIRDVANKFLIDNGIIDIEEDIGENRAKEARNMLKEVFDRIDKNETKR
jgi:hypothetical protein